MTGSTLIAQQDTSGLVVVALVILATLGFVLIAMTLLVKQLKRCPPNRILVIYGASEQGKAAMCIHGGSRLVLPLVQDYRWLSLEPLRIEVSRQRTSSGKTISDPLPRVFSVAIGTTPELMQTAAIRLLGLTSQEITRQAEDMIVAQLDRLLDAVEAGQVQPGTEPFYEQLQTSLEPELSKLGLVLINFRRE